MLIENEIHLSLPIGIEKDCPEFFNNVISIWRTEMECKHFGGKLPNDGLVGTIKGNRIYYFGVMLMFEYEQITPGEWILRLWNFWPKKDR